MRSRALLVCALLAAGCDGEPAPSDPVIHDPRFIGTWLVDQPTHAQYEATLYDFHGDGSLTVRVQIPEGFHTGVVARDGVHCEFASSWRSVGSATLVVTAACADGDDRDIELSFGDPATNAEWADVTIMAVGGEAGWEHPGFEWRFARCESAAQCEDQLAEFPGLP